MQQPTLLDIGVDACSHQAEVDEVRRRLNITHHHFDCWIYNFLENKRFNIEDTLQKLERRDVFEKEQLATHVVTDWMIKNMQKGIIQAIGYDKQGRVVLYVTTARDKPTSSRRDESRMNFDMLLSYATRLRADNKSCQAVLLVNQEKASFWSNLDMTFQADIALRVAKFYPGCVSKVYLCNMGRAMAAMAKPVLSRLTPSVSERVYIVTESEKTSGKLLEFFDESVLPVALGGLNNCDQEENYVRFSHIIQEHFEHMKAGLSRGLSVKEWELECIQKLPQQRQKKEVHVSVSSQLNDTQPQWQHYDSLVSVDSIELFTCDTLYGERYDTHNIANEWCGVESIVSPTQSLYASIRNITGEYTHHFFLLESFFRSAIAETYEREWLSIVQRESQVRAQLLESEKHIAKSSAIFRHIPVSLILLVRGIVWVTLMLMSLFFLLASVIVALIGCFFMVFLFFSMFAEPFHFLPYGCTLIVVGCQLALICSRGLELTRRTYHGKLIDIFRVFGSKALLVQFLICFATVLSVLILFFVVISRDNTFFGFQYALSVGWLIALFIILLYHLLYALGLAGHKKRSHSSNVTMATLYFFLDIDIDEDSANKHLLSLVRMLILLFLVIGVLVFGICFFATHSFAFLLMHVVLLMLFLLLLVFFTLSSYSPASGGLILCAVMCASLAWVILFFKIPFTGWADNWGPSTLILFFMALITCINVLCYACLLVRNKWVRRWMFRMSWIWIVLQFIACLIYIFVIDFRFGLIVLLMGIHLTLYGLRVNGGFSTAGVVVIILVFFFTILTCVLDASSAFSTRYDTPASDWLLPDYHKKMTTGAFGNLMMAPIKFAPICWMRFSPKVDIVGMALFAKLANAATTETTLKDLSVWFPEYKYVTDVSFASPSFLQAKFFEYKSPSQNTTIITLGYTDNKDALLNSSLWGANFVTLYLVYFFMPPSWFVPMLVKLFALLNIFSADPEVNQDFVTEPVSETPNLLFDNTDVYVVGHGIAGMYGALATILSQSSARGVVFSAPMSLFLPTSSVPLPGDYFTGKVLSISSPSSLLFSNAFLHPLTEMLPCVSRDSFCESIESSAITLQSICGT